MGTSVSANSHFESVQWLLRIVVWLLMDPILSGVFLFVFHCDRQRGIDTWIQHTLEQTTVQSTLIQNWLVRGFMSFRKTIKLLSILDLNDVPLSWGETIKEHLSSAGGVSAGGGCSIGGVCICGHRRQGFHHRAACSRHLGPDPITAAEPRQQPHHGGQGNRHPDAHCSQTGNLSHSADKTEDPSFIQSMLSYLYYNMYTQPQISTKYCVKFMSKLNFCH